MVIGRTTEVKIDGLIFTDHLDREELSRLCAVKLLHMRGVIIKAWKGHARPAQFYRFYAVTELLHMRGVIIKAWKGHAGTAQYH